MLRFRVLRLWRGFQVRFVTTAGDSNLRAVPFTRSLQEAKAAYDSYHQSLISYVPSLSPSVKQRFLPFWAVSLLAEAQIFGARLGYRTVRWRYNPATKRTEQYVATRWETVIFGQLDRPLWQHAHDANQDVNMQIYGSYHYRRAYVNDLRSPGCFTGARKLTADMVEQVDGGVTGLEEFRMKPSVALDLAKETVFKTARQDAEQVLQQMFNADSVGEINLHVSYLSVQVAPVYVPSFIFQSRYFGEDLRTFVHGSTLSVGGQRLYHAPLVAFAGGVTTAALVGVMTGNVTAATVVVSATLAGMMALLYPVLAMRFREWWRQREEKKHQWSFFGTWGEEYVNAYGMWEEFVRQEQARQRRAYEQQQRVYEEYARSRRGRQRTGGGYSYGHQTQQEARQDRYKHPDPKGYYSTLGLSPGASEAEVKAAFKALALKHHPDRYQDPKQIEQAKKRFQEISAAYQVLRDPSKKKMYDETGTV